jgi:phosphoglycerol transferase MdoB-like AlkP superfamily enzyme
LNFNIKSTHPVVSFPIRLALFWLSYDALFRLLFILWFNNRWSDETPHKIWASFFYALPLDLSMTGYLLALPLTLWFVGLALGKSFYKPFERVIYFVNILLVWALALIFGANILLYEEWNTPLNNRALEYLATPGAMLDSLSLAFLAASMVLYGLLGWFLWWSYRKVVGTQLYSERLSRWPLTGLPVQAGLVFILIRGGLGVMPINESAVYYSANLFDDHAATNAAWHLIHSLVETRSTENRYRTMDDLKAGSRLEHLRRSVDSLKLDPDMPVLPTNLHPNVVIVVMESMTAQVIESLGGEKGNCPNLEALIRDGVLFNECYGSGYRTDQGIVSILGGYPAQPDQSVILLSDKARKLNSIPKELEEDGYSTLFCYGGELTFANIGVWLRDQHFRQVISESDFPKKAITQRWGVDDQNMLQLFSSAIGGLKAPFFATALTLSLHPPYDVPYHSRWEGPRNHDKFLNSAAFADQAIGAFFKTAAQQPWFDNTIFVLVADHGNSMPGELSMDDPGSRHIPLILYGKPLGDTWKGKRIPVLANHHDIPATLLSLLNRPHEGFHWSRDLWLYARAPEKSFAYYTNENGLGWLTPQGAGFYNFKGAAWQNWSGQPAEADNQDAGAYLQTLYDDFLAL